MTPLTTGHGRAAETCCLIKRIRSGAIQAEAYASGEPQETMRKFFAERAARRKARGRG